MSSRASTGSISSWNPAEITSGSNARELLQPRPHLDVLHHPGNNRFERRRDRRELERDLLVQRQIDADARLERRKQHRIAELVDHLRRASRGR